MTPLQEYCRLVSRYFATIFGVPRPARDEQRESLVREMNAVWPKLNGRDRDLVYQHNERLYLQRINR
jgi:hypothetical protein